MQSLVLVLMLALLAPQSSVAPPRELPAAATAQLGESLVASRAHAVHIWRDSAPVNDDGTVNAYVEIPRGGLEKFEFDMKTNAVAVDRVMPASVGGYPVNYGIVPQTVSYDGDPFDALVLGAPIASGTMVRGVIVGVMHMEDEKGLDSKVVLAVPNADGTPAVALTDADKARIGEYFSRYKRHEPGKFSRVPGWGSAEEGRAFVTAAHAFFRECAGTSGICVPSSLSKR
ncbi:MAG: inorganic diphosphatase [Acidobacteriota bacterium]|nr:inorganic diphosphatase [Acidobacteriota bacterium]